MVLVQRLASLALSYDEKSAAAGYSGMANIASSDKLIFATLPPATMAELAQSYRRLVPQKKVTAELSLDAIFGEGRE